MHSHSRRRFLIHAAVALASALPAPFLSARAAEAAKGFDRWEPEIRAFEAADRTNPPPKSAILFIGSSSIRLWSTLARDFPDKQVINRGFGGSEIADSVHFASRIVFPHRPRQIVMYAGGNDINAGKSPQRVAADFEEFTAKIFREFPEARISYISIAPNPARWTQAERVKEANRLIAAFIRKDARLEFIDVFQKMLGPDGLPRPEIFIEDRLHMNAKGYALWREIISPHLR